MKKIFSMLLVFVLVLSLCACQSEEAQIESAVVLDWKYVHNMYVENEVQAKQEYNNKIVSWTGQIFYIEDGYVQMANETSNGFPLNAINVYLDNDEIAKLSRGQTITVVGKLKLGSLNAEIKNAFVVEDEQLY